MIPPDLLNPRRAKPLESPPEMHSDNARKKQRREEEKWVYARGNAGEKREAGEDEKYGGTLRDIRPPGANDN